MAITDWPAQERPREKLLEKGSPALSDAELLAIFLRTGCKGRSAVDLARDLLHHFGSLNALLGATEDEFCQAKGLGQAKFTQLQAVLEMAKRYFKEPLHKTALTSSDSVKAYLLAELKPHRKEVFNILFLDNQNQLITSKTLFTGTVNAAAIYPREVVKEALKYNASAVIFAHNHPSGIAEPSQADIAITQTLKEALEYIDVRVLDHCIVGDLSVTSMAERGLC